MGKDIVTFNRYASIKDIIFPKAIEPTENRGSTLFANSAVTITMAASMAWDIVLSLSIINLPVSDVAGLAPKIEVKTEAETQA